MAIKMPETGTPGVKDIRWRHPTGGSYIASMAKVGGELYIAGETGIVRCLDAESGTELWKRRGGASYFASPVVSDGNIYLVDEGGDTLIVKAGRSYERVAKNSLGYRTVASPALSDGKIYIRTSRYLYCIGEQP
jgi:outer membrane protein assembly factor BamB